MNRLQGVQVDGIHTICPLCKALLVKSTDVLHGIAVCIGCNAGYKIDGDCITQTHPSKI